jgi:large subunit ribosomal protein L6
MSRVGKKPIIIPAGVDVQTDENLLTVKGPKGKLSFALLGDVEVVKEANTIVINFDFHQQIAKMNAGTVRAQIQNMVNGVTKGYERKLTLIGVGYRAAVQGKKLALTLGFSHPVEYVIPEGITIETPIQTEVLVKGIDKKLVGQVSAEIRAYRPPEVYKGKGVRYSDEKIKIKETKKKK